MVRLFKLGLVSIAILTLACDEPPVRGTQGATSETPAVQQEKPALYKWKSSLVDQRYGGLQTQMAIDANGRPTVAYFAPLYDDLALPDLPEGWEPPLRVAHQGPVSLPDQREAPGDSSPAWQPPDDFEFPGDWQPPDGTGPPDDWNLPEDWAPSPFYALRYARWDGSNWITETVRNVSHARGLSLLQTSGGVAMISYLETDNELGPEWCAAASLNVAVRTNEGWKSTIVVPPAEVLEGDFCTPGEDCPVCDVVGLGSSLAESPDGEIGVSYRRSRYESGTMSNPDTDLEFVTLQLSGTDISAGDPQTVHASEGAGFFGKLQYALDAKGRTVPYIAYADLGELDAETYGQAFGLWLAHYDVDSSAWQKHEIEPDQDWAAGPQIQLLIDGQEIYLILRAIRSESTSVLLDLVLLHSSDRGGTWEREYITSAGRAGSYPSLAMDPSGRLAVSYYHCGDIYEARCTPETDGLMLAVRETSGWTLNEVVNSAGEFDGMYTALAFTENTPVVAARNAKWSGPYGAQTLKVYFGTPNQP